MNTVVCKATACLAKVGVPDASEIQMVWVEHTGPPTEHMGTLCFKLNHRVIKGVSKSGHNLCYSCWKKENGNSSDKKKASSSSRDMLTATKEELNHF